MPVTTVLHQRRWLGWEFISLAGRAFPLPPRVTVVIGELVYPNGSKGSSLKREAVEMSRRVRTTMQRAIDRRSGSKNISRGKMPRLTSQQMEPAGSYGRKNR